MADTLKIGDLRINVSFLRGLSIAIYAVALAATLFVDLHDNVYNELNVSEERFSRREKHEEEFDRELQLLEEETT